MTVPRSLSVSPQNIGFWCGAKTRPSYDSETYAFMKQTEHRAKKPCKHDYASFFKRVTPKHSLLARCKNETYDSKTYAFMKQTEHTAKKPCKYGYASFFKRVIPKHWLLVRCKNESYDSETNRTQSQYRYEYAQNMRGARNKENTETMQI